MGAAAARQPTDKSVEDIDLLRAHEYSLLSALLARAPSAELLGKLAGLEGDASPLGQAHDELADAARAADVARVEREYFSLFIGVGRGELLPYGSFYQTGFLNERPLAAVRRDLRMLGVERVETLHDPEDHMAILFDVMSGLASGAFDAGTVSQADFFAWHIKPWARQFFDDLATAPSSDFYRRVAAIGAAFVEIEAEAFTLDD